MDEVPVSDEATLVALLGGEPTPAAQAVPRRSVLARELERREESLAELDAYYGPAYEERLYRG